VLYDSSARVFVGGQQVPGASAHISNNVTITLDIGYDITKDIALSLMLGVPAKPTVTGEGTLAPLGELGKVRFGPAVLSGYYRWPALGGIRPYTGLGAAYAVVFQNFDAAVTQLKVHNGWGFVLQGGVEYKLTDRFDLFVDYKKIWISLDADGLLNGATSATARAKLDPTLVSAGLKFHFP
jgi:outer membrane protein